MSTVDRLRAKKQGVAGHEHPVNRVHHDEASFGERIADRMAAGIGSWNFLIAQSLIIAIWVVLNTWLIIFRPWDVYPFFLLNFAFTLQAAFTGPVLLLAGKRQAVKDSLMLEHAAAESEASEQQTIGILQETERNTELTLEILKRVRDRRKSGA